MKPRTGFALTLSIVLLAAAAVGWNHRRLAKRTAPPPAARSDFRDADDAARALNRARLQLAGAELARDEQRRMLERERGAPTSSTPPLHLPGEMDALQRMLHDPELNLLQLAAGRAARTVQYGTLVRQLGLSPEQTLELDRILAAKEMREMDVYASGRAQGLATTDPALAALNREIEADTEKALRPLLGDEGYALFQEHDRTAMLRLTVSSLAGAATVAGAPLSPAQSEALVQILAESTPGYAQGRRVKTSQVDWSAADLRIQASLTPAQWEQVRWTEPSGPKGVGGRHFAHMSSIIRAARQADAAAATPRP
ncbi:MAG: hypothetical protein IAE82_10340 [Opitutaceae bacterium]|nr:hypothetical protein [Opitutaceae bacterium]